MRIGTPFGGWREGDRCVAPSGDQVSDDEWFNEMAPKSGGGVVGEVLEAFEAADSVTVAFEVSDSFTSFLSNRGARPLNSSF